MFIYSIIGILVSFALLIMFFVFYIDILNKKIKQCLKDNEQSNIIINHLLYFSLLTICAKDQDSESFKKVTSLIEKFGVSSEIYLTPESYADFIEKLQRREIKVEYDSVNDKYIYHENTGE